MAISEDKMKIVINNYFKDECDVNTSIRQAFEKGFRIGVQKGQHAGEIPDNCLLAGGRVMAELKPLACQFCGSVSLEMTRRKIDRCVWYHVHCKSCDAN